MQIHDELTNNQIWWLNDFKVFQDPQQDNISL